MAARTERQFQAADAAVERAVARFMSDIDQMLFKWDAVFATTVVESLLLTLCAELPKVIDKYGSNAPAALKLSNALADYRDSLFEDR